MRVTSGRTDPELSNILVSNSKDTVFWMHRKGVPMEPALGVAGVRRGNVWYWPPGLVVRAAHEGVGLSNSWFDIAEREGVEIRYSCAVTELLVDRPRPRSAA